MNRQKVIETVYRVKRKVEAARKFAIFSMYHEPGKRTNPDVTVKANDLARLINYVMNEDRRPVQVEGNNGGSYIRLRNSGKEGYCHLEVGESCVVTIEEEVRVAWIAAMLTRCRDVGYAKVLEEYGWDAEHSARIK